MTTRVSAIVLAAGQSRRMGAADKLALACAGQPLIRRALAPLAACALVDELIVVVRPGHELPLDGLGCTVLVNPDCREGMGASLRAGVSAATPGAAAYLIALGDMPWITTALLTTLIEAFFAAGKPILVPVHQGRSGHPVVFDRALREQLLQLRGDVGAREIIRQRPDEVARFETGQRAVVLDVDTPADLVADPAVAMRRGSHA